MSLYLPDDVWGLFIVPHFFSSLSIFKDKKAVKIEGGRGCGKTMLMRYFCHYTVFSQQRTNIPDETLQFIGLYWKPDIRFCKLLTEPWLGDNTDIIFSYYFALSVIEELASSLDNIAYANFSDGAIDLRSLDIPRLAQKYLGTEVKNFSDLHWYVEEKLAELDLWVQNQTTEKPVTFGFKKILDALTNQLASSNPRLKNIFFKIFVDEFENLQPSQQKVINDYIKQPEDKFCVNFAVRSHAISEFLTSTNEQLIDPHDYRTINIEEQLGKNDNNFETLAAEFLLLHLLNEGIELGIKGFSKELLFDPTHISARSTESYRTSVLGKAREIFPQASSKELAKYSVGDNALNTRISKAIRKGLSRRGENTLTEKIFFEDVPPEVTIVAANILNRESVPTKVIIEELNKTKNPKTKVESLFTKTGGWVENTLYGSLLYSI